MKARGADVRVVDATPGCGEDRAGESRTQVVFFGVGFETTAPANGMAVWQAKCEGLKNFSMLVSHVLVPPAMRLILSSPANRVQGFIAPGHVCTVMGYHEYEELVSEFHVPMVVGGFEPLDLLEAISMLVSQLEEGRAEVENQYTRSVNSEGNLPARNILREVFRFPAASGAASGQFPGAVTGYVMNSRNLMPNAFSGWRTAMLRSPGSASVR